MSTQTTRNIPPATVGVIVHRAIADLLRQTRTPSVYEVREVLGATLIGDARVTADDDDPGVKMCGQRPSDTIEARAVPRPTTWP